MKRKPHSTSLVLLLVCIFTFWWGISVLSQHDLRGSLEVTQNTTSANTQAPLMVSESVSGDTYTYSGTFVPASACDSIGSGIRYAAANGGHLSVLLQTQSFSTDCAQAAGTSEGQQFSVSIKLTGAAPQFDGVLLNGSAIPAQLVTAN